MKETKNIGFTANENTQLWDMMENDSYVTSMSTADMVMYISTNMQNCTSVSLILSEDC